MLDLLRKELLELRRTHRGLIALTVFLLFGLSSPVVAKLMPDIIDMIASQMPGAIFELPHPTVFDAYMQFLKNVYQIGMLVIVLLAMGSVAEERKARSLEMLLSKPVSKAGVILAKFCAHGLLTTVALSVSALACVAYTQVIFGEHLAGRILAALVVVHADALFVLALVVLISTLSRNVVACAVTAVAVYLLLGVVGFTVQASDTIVPGGNGALAGFLINGGRNAPEALPAVLATLAAAGVTLTAAATVFRRQDAV